MSKLPSPVWLFDLDNTLHDASHAIFPAISANMNTYIARVLGDGVTPASQEAVDAARVGYWKRYGATLLGMIRHHRVDAADFLRQTHDIGALHELVRYERGLERLLRRLPGRKILLTNAPTAYSTGVVRHIGLQRQFAHHVSIEDMRVHGRLHPKPSKLCCAACCGATACRRGAASSSRTRSSTSSAPSSSACARPGSRNTCATAIRSAKPPCRRWSNAPVTSMSK